ncbi:hypothetical protein J7J59_01555, partial [Candidatus Aerophobetes bacterium]|nr:hypothetical protein [Candidatus Aerophobetes bacterium]
FPFWGGQKKQFSQKVALDKKSEVRSLTEELKTGPGEVKGKKINRPISLGKELSLKALERITFLLRVWMENLIKLGGIKNDKKINSNIVNGYIMLNRNYPRVGKGVCYPS